MQAVPEPVLEAPRVEAPQAEAGAQVSLHIDPVRRQTESHEDTLGPVPARPENRAEQLSDRVPRADYHHCHHYHCHCRVVVAEEEGPGEKAFGDAFPLPMAALPAVEEEPLAARLPHPTVAPTTSAYH